MAAPVAGRAFARSLASSTLTKCSRPQCLKLRAQQSAFRPAIRSFSVSAKVWAKKYTEDHEWVELSADGETATIGISDYAAKAVGDVVYVELPSADLQVAKGESIGAVESVKSASDIMTPISGVIVEANSVLEEKPSTINESPEQDGWLAKIKASNAEELDTLMDADGYRKFTEKADSK
ncbi:Glycine cleavage system H protein, mitochondrial [Fulvia fulva]|uniref:Glycine cleavage system H protein n=1 Tax=Passalora fulva TaxID=5499 RepID=A0A9Q8L9T4_PASFU|nr:Glycine cleavage system H protein, mitochondrial [Fulvia fulva]KAK4631967.1 Glycine cleavage system H protein, mitochondrial [Fulvia fulva]KAK4633155.1 Glycine cleavage system H protein, mitochondrial [Fulvia fulva]UJO13477.1 Glycine cleavage system H protein, mitochondrial [Fulvia fulva]WPV11839.1 Glycine cleavage system H protein, mitochondrial [Fulvia fulva]WPV25623.1 Glycine cleavage system H protein, mitochondrial [Fulvia fulva]